MFTCFSLLLSPSLSCNRPSCGRFFRAQLNGLQGRDLLPLYLSTTYMYCHPTYYGSVFLPILRRISLYLISVSLFPVTVNMSSKPPFLSKCGVVIGELLLSLQLHVPELLLHAATDASQKRSGTCGSQFHCLCRQGTLHTGTPVSRI